jgi:hypothetical protein
MKQSDRVTVSQLDAAKSKLCKRHLKIGWWSLLAFLSLGIILEMLHGMKWSSYLGADAEIRRLLWTLAHSHGTLLAIIHILFGLSLGHLEFTESESFNWTGKILTCATLLMPIGFFLGGWIHYAADPGLGILLVPVGALLLFWAILRISLGLGRS